MATTKSKKIKPSKPKVAKAKAKSPIQKKRVAIPVKPSATKLKITKRTPIKTLKKGNKPKPSHIVRRISPGMWVIGTTVGLALVLTGIFCYLYSQTILSFKVSPMVVAPSHLRNAYPVRIAIEAIQVDVPISPATIKDGIWQMSDSTATYLENSSRPAEGGNVIIYGHNRDHIFAPLHRIKVGEKISLTTASGSVYEYKVNEIKVVPPSAIEEVTPTDYEVLTVYTCTGLFDSQRLVIKAAPTRVESL